MAFIPRSILFLILSTLLLSCSNIPDKPEEQPETQQSQQYSKFVSCDCPDAFSKAPLQVKFPYSDSYLKLCAFDFDTTTFASSELSIFDQNDELIFEGYPPSLHTIPTLTSPLTITVSSFLPNASTGKWGMEPYTTYQFEKSPDGFAMQQEFVFSPPSMSPGKQDSVFSIFDNQPKHNQKYDLNDPPFTSEEYIMDLFLCAANRNSNCLQAYDSLQNRFVTDGAIGELYYELKGILQFYKNQ